MRVLRTGVSREVLMFRRVVLKVPAVRSWRQFVWGVAANLQEAEFSGMLCTPRTLVQGWLGLFLVQERASPVVCREGMFWLRLVEECAKSDLGRGFWYDDAKLDNFGYIGNRFVKVDCG